MTPGWSGRVSSMDYFGISDSARAVQTYGLEEANDRVWANQEAAWDAEDKHTFESETQVDDGGLEAAWDLQEAHGLQTATCSCGCGETNLSAEMLAWDWDANKTHLEWLYGMDPMLQSPLHPW